LHGPYALDLASSLEESGSPARRAWLIFDVGRKQMHLRFTVAFLGAFVAGCSQRSALTHEIFVKQIGPAALEDFRHDVGRYPNQEEGLGALVSPPLGIKSAWRGPYPRSSTAIPPDPWGRSYVYRSPSREKGRSYDLLCLGQDGVETSDDVIFSK
jgi:type II secretion system protein G